LYQATLKGSLNDIAEYTSSIYFGALISLNIFVIVGFLGKLELMSFPFSNKYEVGILMVICILFSLIYFLYKKRYKIIAEKYLKEDRKKRVRGNIIVSVYVVISFLAIFAVAFFRPN
jgi:hypothetical protein